MAARRGKSQARRNSGSDMPGWVWLVAGAAIAAVVFLAAPNVFKKDGDGFLRVGPQPNPDAQPAPVADADIDAAVEAPRSAKASEPAKPATQYDFYTLLPGEEVQMSDAELAASAKAEEQRRVSDEAQRARAALEGRPVSAPLPPAVSESPATVPAPLREPAPATVAASTTPATTTTAAPVPAPATAAPAAAAGNDAPAVAAASAPAAEANVRYILQAGAFGASGDAEATKAKLAMMGITARVESAQISGKTVYRVRMGPYGTAGELAEAKQKLASNGMQAMAIKAQ